MNFLNQCSLICHFTSLSLPLRDKIAKRHTGFILKTAIHSETVRERGYISGPEKKHVQ
jgi:hypothetical protein